jgi:hypothetical protein
MLEGVGDELVPNVVPGAFGGFALAAEGGVRQQPPCEVAVDDVTESLAWVEPRVGGIAVPDNFASHPVVLVSELEVSCSDEVHSACTMQRGNKASADSAAEGNLGITELEGGCACVQVVMLGSTEVFDGEQETVDMLIMRSVACWFLTAKEPSKHRTSNT